MAERRPTRKKAEGMFSRWWQVRVDSWLERRIPATRSITLNHRSIFIFLSGRGYLFLMLLVCLFIGGINYANNLLLAMCFLLASLGIVVMHYTYLNLSGLVLRAVSTEPTYAGERAAFVLGISRVDGRVVEPVCLTWGDEIRWVSVPENGTEVLLRFYLPAAHRGWLLPPRLHLETFWPLGILRAWSWPALDMRALVYPKPVPGERMPFAEGGGDDGGERVQVPGREDFDSLRDYAPGDPLRQVDWKALARGQGMKSKVFVSWSDSSLWLDYAVLPSADREWRLSRLTHAVQRLAQEGKPFGLRLPGQQVDCAQGVQHREECLRMLALYGLPAASVRARRR